jgi:hypothetical protein
MEVVKTQLSEAKKEIEGLALRFSNYAAMLTAEEKVNAELQSELSAMRERINYCAIAFKLYSDEFVKLERYELAQELLNHIKSLNPTKQD